VSVPVSDACRDLLELFAGVPDGRVGQGRDHLVAAVLALAAAAVAAGPDAATSVVAAQTEVGVKTNSCRRRHEFVHAA
jgi:hypothetical protein